MLRNMPSISGLTLMTLLSNLAGISFAASGGSAGGSSGGQVGGGGSIDFSGLDDQNVVIIVVVVFIVCVIFYSIVRCLVGKNIIMIQVALSGEAKLLLKDINRIARTTSTHSMSGCRQILIGSTLVVIRKSQYFISAYTLVEQKWMEENVMDRFKYLSKQEHEKFDIESLVNFNDTIIQLDIPRANQLPTDYIVVTFLVATSRELTIPQVRCIKSMEEALKHLNEIETHELLAVEVLWTPQNENDNLSKQEFLAKYPRLKP